MAAKGSRLRTASTFMSIGRRLLIGHVALVCGALGLSTVEKDALQTDTRRSVMRSDVGPKAQFVLTGADRLRDQEPDGAAVGEPATGTAPVAPGAPVAGGAGAGVAGEGVAGEGGTVPATSAAEPAAGAPLGGAAVGAEGAAEGEGLDGNETEADDGGTEADEAEGNHLGVMLLGFITFMITLFYGVNYHDADVRYSVWCTLQDSISLLCGVLIFHSFKDCMVVQFGETDDSEGHTPPNLRSLIVAFIRLLIAFWLSQFTLLRYRKDERKLMAWGIVLGNVVAFCAIDSLGMIQQIAPFADNPANALLGVIVASVMMMCMSVSGHIVRQYWMTWETGSITEEEAKWDAQCEKTEDHFSGIAVGMLMSIVIRYAIDGEMPPIWGAPKYKTEAECAKLFGTALGLSFPIFFVSLAAHSMSKSNQGNGNLKWIVRSMKVMQTTMAMTMGWSLMYACRWQWWSAAKNEGDKMTARLMLALIFSYVGFILIVVVDRIGDKVKVGKEGFSVVNEAFSLGIGMSWEGAFSEAVDEFAEEYGGAEAHARAWTEIMLAAFLIFLILPAWVWYILPKVLAGPEGKEEKKPEAAGEEAAGEQEAPPPGEEAPGEAAAGEGEEVAKAETEQAPPGEEAGGASAEAYGGEDAGGWDQDQAWDGGGQGDQGWDESGWDTSAGGWDDTGGNAGARGGRTSSTWGAGGKGRGAEGKGGRGAKGAGEDDGSAAF